MGVRGKILGFRVDGGGSRVERLESRVDPEGDRGAASRGTVGLLARVGGVECLRQHLSIIISRCQSANPL